MDKWKLLWKSRTRDGRHKQRHVNPPPHIKILRDIQEGTNFPIKIRLEACEAASMPGTCPLQVLWAGRDLSQGMGCLPTQWQGCLQEETSRQHRTQHRIEPSGLQMPLRTPLGFTCRKKPKTTTVAAAAKALETRQQENRQGT